MVGAYGSAASADFISTNQRAFRHPTNESQISDSAVVCKTLTCLVWIWAKCDMTVTNFGANMMRPMPFTGYPFQGNGQNFGRIWKLFLILGRISAFLGVDFCNFSIWVQMWCVRRQNDAQRFGRIWYVFSNIGNFVQLFSNSARPFRHFWLLKWKFWCYFDWIDAIFQTNFWIFCPKICCKFKKLDYIFRFFCCDSLELQLIYRLVFQTENAM